MKKSIWLAIVGAAALTGCQSEVMQQREYVPAPREDVEPAKPVVDNRAVERQEIEPARQQQQPPPPAVHELPAMKETFRNEGVNENDPVGGKSGKKDAKGAKKGAKKGAGKAVAGPGEYVVRSGDTPEKIARKHHVRLSDLMEVNNLTEESAKKLRIGQKLVIPARRAGKKGAAAAKGGKRKQAGPAAEANAASQAPAANPGEYVVRSGDTPEKIAKRHHVRLSDLMDANNLTPEDARKLRIGQKLVIPAGGAAPRKAVQAGGEKNSGSAPQGRDLDDDSGNAPAAPVRKGAVKLNRTEVENGYLVEVPYDMTVAEFAKLAGVSEEELRRLNPDMPDETLKKDNVFITPKTQK